ncbi:MAG: histidine phosphatase family protein [Saprospiraceae bacterium]
MKKHIYIIRHGQTDMNLNGIVQGSGVDSSLNDTGRAQAAAFHKMYKNVPFEIVITSRLKRTHETAQPFLDVGITWEQMSEINEISWGIHEGKKGTPTDREEYSQLMQDWRNGLFDSRITGGESAAEMQQRMVEFKNQLLRRPEEYILVVSHGRAMRCMMTVLLNRPLSEMDDFKHSNTGLYQFELENEEFVAVKLNDRAHREKIQTN